MTEIAEKRTVEEIVEANNGGIESMASWIYGIQCDAANFVEQFRDPNKEGRPMMWDVVDYHGLPREFMDLCLKLAEYEVRL